MNFAEFMLIQLNRAMQSGDNNEISRVMFLVLSLGIHLDQEKGELYDRTKIEPQWQS